MKDIDNVPFKPCVVFIERWIASNKVGEDVDNENVRDVVNDERISEINTETTSHKKPLNDNNEPLNADKEPLSRDNGLLNGENERTIPRNVSGLNSLTETLEVIHDDQKAESKVQQLISNSVSAASLLLDIQKNSKSERKSNKEKRQHSHRPKSSLQSSISNCLNDDLFSDHRDDFVEEGVEQGTINAYENISNSYNVDEEFKREEFNATRSPSNLFELGHALYEEMVVDIPPISVDTNNHESDVGSQNSNRPIISEDLHGEAPGGQGDSHKNYIDAVDYMEQNVPRHYSEYAESREDDKQDTSDQQPQNRSYPIGFPDDDDSNQPIDYSMSNQYSVPTHQSVQRNDSTIYATEWRSFSPSTKLRTGFARNWQPDDRFLQYPARYHVDDPLRANRKSLYFPVPQYQGKYDNFGTEHEELPVEIEDFSGAPNRISEHTSGTAVEKVDASSQTDIQSIVVNAYDEKFCRMFMENSNFNLTMFLQSFYSVAHLVFNTAKPAHTSNCGSASSGESSCNLTSYRENPSDQRLEDVMNHEVSSDSKSMETENISNGCRMKNNKKTKKKKGIPVKRSERLLEIAARKGKELQDVKETEVVPTKKSKIDVNLEFEVENVSVSADQAYDDNLLDAVPRRINFAQTPMRPSKYWKRKLMEK